jgi:hypothetical protein
MFSVVLCAWSDFYSILQKQRICHLSDECGCMWKMFAFLSYLRNTYIINWMIIIMNGARISSKGAARKVAYKLMFNSFKNILIH